MLPVVLILYDGQELRIDHRARADTERSRTAYVSRINDAFGGRYGQPMADPEPLPKQGQVHAFRLVKLHMQLFLKLLEAQGAWEAEDDGGAVGG